MSADKSPLRSAIMGSFSNPNPESIGVFRMIDEVYPSFAKKIFQNNDFMRDVVMSGYSPMHILDYPICGRCETIAAYSGANQCSCFGKGCGATTVNPITFRQWLIMELKRKAPASFMENVEVAVDAAAMGMMQKYIQDAKAQLAKEKGGQSQGMGILDMYGNEAKQEHYEVTQEIRNSKVDLEEERRKIAEEEN